MAPKTNTDDNYEKLQASIKSGEPGCFYIFHGTERYLLEHSLSALRQCLCPDGLNSFNYKRLEGKSLKPDALDGAVSTLPLFAQRTLVEIHDPEILSGKKKAAADSPEDDGAADPGKAETADDSGVKQQLYAILSDLPEYVCVVIVFDTIPYSPDLRRRNDKELLRRAQVVEFAPQEQSKLIKWINRRFTAAGKRISRADAEYLISITDGHMAALAGEIEKIAAYCGGGTVSRDDIDAVVTPTLSAFSYKLTDALAEGRHTEAMRVLSELLAMREPPQKILYSISAKMRQLLMARVAHEDGLGKSELTSVCGIRYDFQARNLLNCARNTSLNKCAKAVILCANAAYDLNSAPEPEGRLVELVTRIAFL